MINNKKSWRILRTQWWIDHLLLKFGGSRQEFENIYLSRSGEATKQTSKWHGGKTVVTERIVSRFEKLIPGTSWVFYLDCFLLLDETTSYKRSLKGYLDKHSISLQRPIWFFERDFYQSKPPPLDPKHQFMSEGYIDNILSTPILPVIELDNSWRLVQRADIEGFTAILALVRDAERKGNVGEHIIHISNLYRSIPALTRYEFMIARLPLLISCVINIHKKVPASFEAIQPNTRYIQQLIGERIAIPAMNLDATSFDYNVLLPCVRSAS